MSGISSLLGAIVAIMITAIVGIGVIHYYNTAAKNQNILILAQKTAYYDGTFLQALDSYVNVDSNNLGGKVTCSDLQTAGFLSANYDCVNPLGETLTGYVSSPWGFPQTWFMTVDSFIPDTNTELAKFGIDTQLEWKAFEYQVSQDLTDSDNLGAVLNAGNFTLPQSNINSNLSAYFPVSGVNYPQTLPVLSYYDGFNIIAGNFQLNPGYWIIQAQEYDSYTSAYVDTVNLGYSAVCPLSDNGVLPANIPSGNILSQASISNVEGGGAGWGFLGSMYNIFNFCLPATQNLVNSSYIFPDASNTDTNFSDNNNYPCSQINFEITSPPAPPDFWENGCSASSSQTAISYIGVPVQGESWLPKWDGLYSGYLEATIPDLNVYYDVTVGNATYILIVSMGNISGTVGPIYNWNSYISATLWYGNLTGNIYINPSGIVNDSFSGSSHAPLINYNLRNMGTFNF